MNDYRDYPPDVTEVSRGVLVEVFTLLQPEREHCVLVGGWAPYLLTERHKPAEAEFVHIGSVDIDVALDFERLPKLEEVYAGIRHRLERVGFAPRRSRTGQPLAFSLEKPVGNSLIHADFLAPVAGGTGDDHRHQRAQDLLALKARGCEVAFQSKELFEVEAVMPSRARHAVQVPVAGPAAVLCMKALAFSDDPGRIKDAYDICSILRYYKAGATSVAAEIRPLLDVAIMQEALGRLATSFRAMDAIGPVGLANFLQPEHPATPDWDLERRNGYEAVQSLLEAIAYS